jgi:soluble lytic murein transglycosylase-like protein
MPASRIWWLLVALLPVTMAAPAHAGIFAFTDDQGTVHYSNVPVDTRFRPVISVPDAGRPTDGQLLQRSEQYANMIEGAARANGLEPALVRAVLVAESGGDPHAISRRGARGLMQLMPATARRYGVRDVFDPEQNIRAGSHYLRDLIDRYSSDLELVLAAYNAGPAAVDQHGGSIPPIKETLQYVPRVLQIYEHLRDLARKS